MQSNSSNLFVEQNPSGVFDKFFNIVIGSFGRPIGAGRFVSTTK